MNRYRACPGHRGILPTLLVSMVRTAERVGETYGITRERKDHCAVHSQERAHCAAAEKVRCGVRSG